MSVISQLLLNRIWQNFKRRFLWPCWTDSKCQCDICPGNICPGNICPVQEYLTCYWPIFDPTFWTKFWQALISLDPKCFWSRHFFEPNFTENWPKLLLVPNFFLTKQIFEHTFFCIFVHRICGSKFFWTQLFLQQIFILPYFFDVFFSYFKFFWSKIFSSIFFFDRIFLASVVFEGLKM